MRGRKPKPRRGSMLAKDALPRCPPQLSAAARKEWRRLATPLFEAGVLTLGDRAAFAAYCQTRARWVEAEAQLARTPPLRRLRRAAQPASAAGMRREAWSRRRPRPRCRCQRTPKCKRGRSLAVS